MTPDYLWTELARVDALVRAQTLRWRATVGENKPPKYWGMVLVTDAEIDAFMNSPFTPPGHLSAELRERMAPLRAQADRLATHPGSRLSFLRDSFRLSALEHDVLALCLLPELDDRYRRLFAYLQDDASRRLPTVELVLQILQGGDCDPASGRSAFAPGGPLRAHRLVLLDDSGPLPLRQVRIDDRVVDFLVGSTMAESPAVDWLAVADPMPWTDLIVPPDRLAQLQGLARWWQGQSLLGDPATLFLHGPYGSGRRTAAQAICTADGTPLLVADTEAALRNGIGWTGAVDLVRREAVMRGAAVLWRDIQTLLTPEHAGEWARLRAGIEAMSGLVFLSSTEPWDPAGRGAAQVPFVRLTFPIPGYEQRTRMWVRRLADLPDVDAAAASTTLANDFQFTGGQIDDAVATARGHAVQRDPDDPAVNLDDLYEGCRRQSSRRIISFTRRVEPRPGLSFDNLVLPGSNQRQLDEVRSRIRNRGRVTQHLNLGTGMVVLFTGPSGTGKTMAAMLLAQEQGVELYKVDLSAVVSKWVGETEKNMHRLFADAEDANAILFFDEAEALFGKRGEVKDAQDRWANLETNYLLQRVEEYHGVVILTSNLRQNLDPAFLRRIKKLVDFPKPDETSRALIWQRTLPAGVLHPPDAVIQELARRLHKLTGGNIHNAVVDATYRAIDADPDAPRIEARHLVAGVAREYQKLGEPLTRGEFGAEFYDWLTDDILSDPDGPS